VVGGLFFSQIITLYITPVVYTYMDAFQQRLAGRAERRRARRGGLGEAAPVAAAPQTRG
jgi:HAE1 family hydrophobic/amphiphilic exporter-1